LYAIYYVFVYKCTCHDVYVYWVDLFLWGMRQGVQPSRQQKRAICHIQSNYISQFGFPWTAASKTNQQRSSIIPGKETYCLRYISNICIISVDRCLFFFFWPLCCLSFNLRILITYYPFDVFKVFLLKHT
jgi:hypothetical protein